MKNKIMLVLSVLLIVAGSVLGYLATFTAAQVSSLALTMFGAGILIANMWQEKKETARKWLTVLALALVSIGAFVAGLTGVIAEQTVSQVIGYVFSLVAIVAGIVTTAIAQKKSAE